MPDRETSDQPALGPQPSSAGAGDMTPNGANSSPVEHASLKGRIADKEEDKLHYDGQDSIERKRGASNLLRKAAEDCQVLVAYIARMGDPKATSEMVSKREYIRVPEKVLDGFYSIEDEAKLWTLLNELTIAAEPATAESIRDSNYAKTLGTFDKEKAGGHRLRRVWAMGTIAFLLTLCVGLYVSITETIVLDSAKLAVEYERLLTKKTEGTRIEGLVDFGNHNSSTSGKSPPSSGSGYTEDKEKSATPQSAAGGSEDQPPPIQADDAKDSSFDSRNDEAEFLLERAKNEVAAEYKSGLQILRFTTFGLSGNESTDSEQIGVPGEVSVFNRVPEKIQRYVNNVMGSYVLPLCAAVLGAFVFIIRDRGRRLESISLSSQQGDTYFPRLIVAAIAGIIIGWFSSQDATGVLGKLSPAAGAFVVGYSIEIMFNILDSIKQALGVKDS